MNDLVSHNDYETRSAIDLKKHGTAIYAAHPSTEVLTFSYWVNGQLRRWRPGQPNPVDLFEHLARGGLFYAHNAAFEFWIWNMVCRRYGWPPLRIEQVRCTMAMALAMSIPGALGDAAAALGLDIRKDDAGHRIMLQLCKPRSFGKKSKSKPGCPTCAGTGVLVTGACHCVVWYTREEFPEKYAALESYCDTDVLTEKALHDRLLELDARETAVWALDQKINAYGVRIDVPAVQRGIAMVKAEKGRMDAEMQALTGGHVETCASSAALTEWLCAQGAVTAGVAKADVKALLDSDELPGDTWNDDDLTDKAREPGPVRRALVLRQIANKASTAKMGKMLDSIGPDHLARMLYQYHAAHTGRWGGRRIQPQNMMRPFKQFEDVEQQEAIIACLLSGASPDELRARFGQPMDAIASVMRGFLLPHVGNEFVIGDYSNIEGRGLAWLAGDEDKLEAFRRQDNGTGPEIYIVAGAKIYGVDPATLTKKSQERQIGKVAELALGFQGGAGAFISMGRIYGIHVAEKRADEIKDAWRDAHPLIAGYRTEYGRKGGYWANVERAAINAVKYPGTKHAAGAEGRETTYLVNGSFLWARLPSGRCLCYPYPELRNVVTAWGQNKETLTYKTALSGDPRSRRKLVPDLGNTGKWGRITTYGGSLTENNDQAICRDVQADAMLRLDRAGLPIAMHTHDEIVGEVPRGRGKELLPHFNKLMAELPPWAAGLPVVVDGFVAQRYRK